MGTGNLFQALGGKQKSSQLLEFCRDNRKYQDKENHFNHHPDDISAGCEE